MLINSINLFPIQTLFNPDLKIDLALFLKDQEFFHELAQCINGDGKIDDFLNLKKVDPKHFAIIHQACEEARKASYSSDDLNGALLARIFTLKNAILAQEKPEAILESPKNKGIVSGTPEKIKELGIAFIKASLRLHLESIRKPTSDFKQDLTAVAENLIPFVKKVTFTHLKDHQKNCTDNPLTFREAKGSNINGLIAATIMEVCLKALGFQSRLMQRTDLESKVTAAIHHRIVVISNKDQQYIVDPTYTQFFEDVTLDKSNLPKSPVLVLNANEVSNYVNNNLMVLWKVLDFQKDDATTLTNMHNQDKHYAFHIQSSPLGKDVIPSDVEEWVRDAFQRVWDVKTYRPVYTDLTFHQVFLGHPNSKSVYKLIEPMKLASLTPYLSEMEIEKRLTILQTNSKVKNTPEALRLIAQHPHFEEDHVKEKFLSLLNINPRIDHINTVANAYYVSLCKIVNPSSQDLKVLYGCSGADCVSVMLATNATDFTFVDMSPLNLEEFKTALNQVKKSDADHSADLILYLEKQYVYFSQRKQFVGDLSPYGDKHEMPELPLKFFHDLAHTIGDLNTVSLKAIEKGIEVSFEWAYDEKSPAKKRTITLVRADIIDPKSYPSWLQKKIEKGLDIFYMKAPFFAPRHYPQFLPNIAKSINANGWLMTCDKAVTMEEYDPKNCLTSAGLQFKLMEDDEEMKALKMSFEKCLNPIDMVLQVPHRLARLPGTDFTYWTLLNLRKRQ